MSCKLPLSLSSTLPLPRSPSPLFLPLPLLSSLFSSISFPLPPSLSLHAGNLASDHVIVNRVSSNINNNNDDDYRGSSFVSLDSFNAILDASLNELLTKVLHQQGKQAY